MRAHVEGDVSRRGAVQIAPFMTGCMAVVGVALCAHSARDLACLPPEHLHPRGGLVPGRLVSETA